jgi:hypothetical protein
MVIKKIQHPPPLLLGENNVVFFYGNIEKEILNPPSAIFSPGMTFFYGNVRKER